MDHPVSAPQGWWRRNALALGALVVLVPAALLAYDQFGFGDVRNPSLSAAANELVTVGDAQIGQATITPLDPEEVGAPTGTAPVLVSLHIIPGDDALTCLGTTVTEPSTGRTWRTELLTIGWRPDSSQTSSCHVRSAEPFDVSFPVLLADDATGDLVVQATVGAISDDGGDSTVDLRFALDS